MVQVTPFDYLRVLALPALLALGIVFLMGAYSKSTAYASGVKGTVRLIEHCTTSSCTASAYQAELIVKDRQGSNEVARVKANRAGVFELRLPPGEYLVLPEPNGFTTDGSGGELRRVVVPGGVRYYPYAQAQRITIPERDFAHITVDYAYGF